MPDFLVKTSDGSEIKVSADAITPPGGQFIGASADYFHKDIAAANTAEAVKQRTKGLISRDKAAEDADLVRVVLEKHGKKSELDIEAIRKEEAAKYAPQIERAARLEQGITDASIIEAARAAGIKDDYLKPIVPGQPAPIVQQVRGAMHFHEELGYPVARLGEGYAPAKQPTAARPFAGTDHVFETLKADKGLAYLFAQEQPQGGAGYAGGGSGGQSDAQRYQEVSQLVRG